MMENVDVIVVGGAMAVSDGSTASGADTDTLQNELLRQGAFLALN